MQKRGMSFIAVILLVAFVVILGVGFYIYATNFTEDRIDEVTKDEDCNSINIQILEACFTENQVKIKLESKGSTIDKGFLVKLIGDTTELIPSPPLTTLQNLNVQEINLPYGDSIGDLKEVEIIPKISTSEEPQIVCPIQGIKQDISPCR